MTKYAIFGFCMETIKNSNKDLTSIVSTLIENSNDAIVSVNINGTVMSTNKGAERMSGYAEEEVVGKPLAEVVKMFVLDDRKTEFNFNFQKLKEGQKIENFETQRKRKDGSIMDLSTSVYPLKNNEGMMQGFFFIAKDITPYKNSMHLKDQFISTASHELRTPLTAVKTAFEILKSKGDNLEKAKKDFLIETVNRNIERLDHLISDLLDFSKVKAPQNHVVIQKILVKDLVNEIIKQLFSKKSFIKVNIQEGVEALSADYDKLIQILSNLINNAIHFAKSKVNIEIKQDMNTMTFSVTDDGYGIEKEDLSLLFNPFVQIRSGDRGPQGTGFGLAICKELVTLHFGAIWAESEPNHHTTFFFSIPRNLK